MRALIILALSAFAILFTAFLIPGIKIKNIFSAFLVAGVLSIINVFITPIMVYITLPITIITYGLFLFIINALVIMMAGVMVPGFQVKSFGSAMFYSIVLCIISYSLEQITGVPALPI